MLKFNVHRWNGKDWEYVATAQSENEQSAAKAVAHKFNLSGRFASYPHIDTYQGQVTSRTNFTVIIPN